MTTKPSGDAVAKRSTIEEDRARRNRRLLLAAAVLLVLLVVATGGWAWITAAGSCPGAFNDGSLTEIDGECVGVTDGSYSFAPELDGISARIRAENERVDALDGTAKVSVAFLQTMTLRPQDPLTYDSALAQLEGAFAAQMHWNHDNGNVEPQLRLLLANPGSLAKQWSFTVDRLVERSTGPDNLRAVAGLGASVDGTFQTIAALNAAGIPSVGSVMTANPDIPDLRYFARVAPTNTQEAAALVRSADPAPQRPMLITDTKEGDQYTQTLHAEFVRLFPQLAEDYEQYDSGESGLLQAMDTIVNRLCSRPPDLVLFAGRGKTGLPEFLSSLSARNPDCRRVPIRVLTGDDAAETALTEAGAAALARGDVTVRYTSLSHPEQWRNVSPDDEALKNDMLLYRDDMRPFFANELASEPDNDGHAMLAYDAMQVATYVVRETRQTAPDLSSVRQAWGQLGSCVVVPGVSGDIVLDKQGNPVDKMMALVTLRADGTAADPVRVWPTEDGRAPKGCGG